MNGTMRIFSPKDYQIAISSGNDKTLVEIPNTPFPIKETKAARHAENGKKEKNTDSSTEALREGSVDTDAADETERSRPTASKQGRGSFNAEKSPAVVKPAPSKMSGSEKDSSEYETSGEDVSSYINERPRPSRGSTIKPPMVTKSKPRSFVDSAVETSTIQPPTRCNSKGARSSSLNETNHETSEDEMEDWEIEPGVIAGSGSDSDDDSETKHGKYSF
jgi:hypothetical protein